MDNERLLSQLELNRIILCFPKRDPTEFDPVDKAIIAAQDAKTVHILEVKYAQLLADAVKHHTDESCLRCLG